MHLLCPSQQADLWVCMHVLLVFELAEGMPKKAAAKRSPRFHHTIDQRVAALVAYYSCAGIMWLAQIVFFRYVPEDAAGQFSNAGQFIRDVVNKWEKFTTVLDRYGERKPSRPKLVSDEIIKECATAFKSGYTKRVFVRQPGPDGDTCEFHEVHRYYTSINEACCDDPVLSSVIDQYAVTPQYLLERMHQMDPNLCKRVVEFKYLLSPEQQASRQQIAALLLKQWRLDQKLLLTVWWIDETSLWIIRSDSPKQKVWADAHDKGVRAVLSSPHVRSQNEIKVHCMGAVNAMFGAGFFEFTTGTTDIRRQCPRPEGAYMVSHKYPSLVLMHLQPAIWLCMYAT